MTIRALIAVAACLSTNLSVAAPRSADAAQFDIAGVKLGMSPSAATAAITERLRIDKRLVEFDKFPQMNPVTNSREPKYFTVTTGNVSIAVHFEPNVPFNPKNKMVVSMVVYEQTWTPDNVAAMKQMALEKYGQPSNGTIGVSLDWCLKPDINPGLGCGEFYGPKLTLSGTKLQLENFQYRQAVIDFNNKSQSSKPVF